MSNGKQVKAAIVLWNGGDESELNKLVETLAPWFGGEATVVQDEEPEPEEPDPEEEPEQEPEQEPVAPRNKVPEEEVAEWVRRSEAGESIAEIARDVGRPISTVYGRVKAAKARK